MLSKMITLEWVTSAMVAIGAGRVVL